jgi:response regulator RpfG family c-di-GMP phosphodiesterase
MNRLIERHVVISVDDEPAILSSLRRCLRSEPYELLTTDDPDRVLQWITKLDVSLVITDQKMPGLQGTDLLEEVSKRSPSTARIILTSYPEDTCSVPGVRGRTECLISKPWDNGMLRRTIRQLLQDREWDLEQEEQAVRR